MHPDLQLYLEVGANAHSPDIAGIWVAVDRRWYLNS